MSSSKPASTATMISYDISFGSNYEWVDFRRKPMRRAMGRIGRTIRARARKMVARKAISDAANYPGSKSGELKKAIGYKVSRPGLLVVIQPKKTARMDEFYPAFLNYGAKDRKRGGDLSARKNYITDAAELEQSYIAKEIYTGMIESLDES